MLYRVVVQVTFKHSETVRAETRARAKQEALARVARIYAVGRKAMEVADVQEVVHAPKGRHPA